MMLLYKIINFFFKEKIESIINYNWCPNKLIDEVPETTQSPSDVYEESEIIEEELAEEPILDINADRDESD